MKRFVPTMAACARSLHAVGALPCVQAANRTAALATVAAATSATWWHQHPVMKALQLHQRCFAAAAAGNKKSKQIYLCSDCGAEQAKWSGQCATCGEWNTLKAFTPPPAVASRSGPVFGRGGTSSNSNSKGGGSSNGAAGSSGSSSSSTNRSSWLGSEGQHVSNQLTSLRDVSSGDAGHRIKLGSDELDRLLGGGLMPGSVVLVGGSPGVGKSTLMMQLADLLSHQGTGVAYVSGEESAHQLKARASRLGMDASDVAVLNETSLNAVLDQLVPPGNGPLPFQTVIVDSIQTMYLEGITSAAGSVTQVRECAMQLLQFAKRHQVAVFLVGHVTKSGDLAGPRILEHLVDTVLSVEGDNNHTHRIVRAVKNRFGSTSEVGVFDMSDAGLLEVADPAALFLSTRPDDEEQTEAPGCAVTATVDGSRSMCVEIQALCTPTQFEYPRHRSSGIPLDRVFMLLAVLSRYAKLRPRRNDVFVNVVGGLRLLDPAVDLAVALAIASSMQERPLPRQLAMVAEVGLAGELRSVPHLQKRLDTAARLGFTRCIVPKSKGVTTTRAAGGGAGGKAEHASTPGMKVIPVATLADALAVAKLF